MPAGHGSWPQETVYHGPVRVPDVAIWAVIEVVLHPRIVQRLDNNLRTDTTGITHRDTYDYVMARWSFFVWINH